MLQPNVSHKATTPNVLSLSRVTMCSLTFQMRLLCNAMTVTDVYFISAQQSQQQHLVV